MNLEKRERRAKLIADARKLVDAADTAQRSMTGDEQAQFDRMMAEAGALKAEYEREEQLAAAERELGEIANPERRAAPAGPPRPPEAEAEKRAFTAFLRRGTMGLAAEERGVLERRNALTDPELRALTTATGSSGGFTIPTDFSNQLEVAMKAWGGMLGAVDVIPSENGSPLPWPTANDTANIGRRINENTAINTTGVDPAFGVVNFGAYLYTTDAVLVPLTLLQDSAFNLDAQLAEWLGIRLGRIVNQECTTGTGASQPRGIVTAAAVGKVGGTGQTASVTFDDLIDLVFAINPAYRPGSKFMMNDSTLGIVAKLKDGQGRYLWQPQLTGEDAIQIMGKSYPVCINLDMPVMAANAKSILFGDLRKYKIRRVKDIVLFRLAERYADLYQVGFTAFARYDGNLVDAGMNPVKYYQNSAS